MPWMEDPGEFPYYDKLGPCIWDSTWPWYKKLWVWIKDLF